MSSAHLAAFRSAVSIGLLAASALGFSLAACSSDGASQRGGDASTATDTAVATDAAATADVPGATVTADATATTATATTDAATDPGEAELPPIADGQNSFAYLIVDPVALDFGAHAVGAILTRDLELENAGNQPLTLRAAFVNGTDAFGTNAGQALVAPGEKKRVKVSFYAPSEGVFEDLLRFESNAVNGAVLDVPVRGVVSPLACQDQDGDGYGLDCALGADCNDSDPTIHVGAAERCDGEDQDCDGLHDEDFLGLRQPCEVGFGACTAMGVRLCAPDGISLQCSVNPVTGGSELCNDVDDDCDGAVDEEFPSKGKLCSVGLGACRVVDKYVCSADKASLVCNVKPIAPGKEICGDGIDNDCDGITDEGELEVCGDGLDNDCDGNTDESGSSWGEVFFARNWYAETIAIYPAHADGTFAPAKILDLPNTARWGVLAVGDFDGDRWLDLVVTETPTDGHTICSVPADCANGSRCAGGVCRKQCDASHGGAASCPAGQTCIDFSPYANDPTDTFCQPPIAVDLARSSCDGEGGIEVTHLFDLLPGESIGPAIDADGNGHLDFVGLGHWGQKKGFVWLNDGHNNFVKVDPAFDYATLFGPVPYGYWVWGITKMSKDMDGDGIVDILGRSFASGGDPPTDLWVLRGNGDGTFKSAISAGAAIPKPANLLIAADFDSDGDQDVVGGCDDDGDPGATYMLLSRGQPGGTSWVAPYKSFDVAPSYNNGGDEPGVGYGTAYDFDRDGQSDVLAGWIPEECGSYVWGCPNITDTNHTCYGGNCRKIGMMRNRTKNACPAGMGCLNGQCQPGCTPDCSGRQCGDDGCGGSCGVCSGGQLCSRGGCVVDCVPDCQNRVCGEDGCGGTCGDCAAGQSCIQGQCIAGCVPNCSGRTCGDDGCGGACVMFGAPEVIAYDANPYINVEAPTNVPPTRPVIAIDPASPVDDDALTCTIVTPSYDLDAVRYHYRWFKNGTFSRAAGDQAGVAPALTAPGDVWQCRVWATDGLERSAAVQTEVTIAAPPPPRNP